MKTLRQLEYGQPLELENTPIPAVQPGCAVVKILYANVISYMKDIYNGVRKYPYPTPLTPGSSAIGRVHALGPDNTSLEQDQLVLLDITFRSRSQPTHVFLSAIHEGYTEGSKRLMAHWRDGSYAEYMLCPLEQLYPLNETRLCSQLHYRLTDLLYLAALAVPFGGLADIDLRPGETVLIAPATGGFGTAACHVALALGARVLAMGRNTTILTRLAKMFEKTYPQDRFVTCEMKETLNDNLKVIATAATGSPIDAFFDISPPAAAKSSHFQAGIISLRHGGRVSMMGGQREDVPIPYVRVMHWNLQLRGKWMFEQSDLRRLIQLVETGVLPLGEKGGVASEKEFSLEEWKEAFDWAENTDTARACFKL